MNRLLYAATIAVAVIISAVGAHAWTLFTTDKVAPAPQVVPAPAPVPPTGRYVLYLSPLNARDVFMLDTVTGKIWQRVELTDVWGQPTVWNYMDRLDNIADTVAFVQAHGAITTVPPKPKVAPLHR